MHKNICLLRILLQRWGAKQVWEGKHCLQRIELWIGRESVQGLHPQANKFVSVFMLALESGVFPSGVVNTRALVLAKWLSNTWHGQFASSEGIQQWRISHTIQFPTVHTVNVSLCEAWLVIVLCYIKHCWCLAIIFPFVFLGGSCGWDEGVDTFSLVCVKYIQIVLLM